MEEELASVGEMHGRERGNARQGQFGTIHGSDDVNECQTDLRGVVPPGEEENPRVVLFPMADEKLQKCSVDDEIESEGGNRVFERSSENGVKRQRHEKSRPRIQTMIEQLPERR